MEIDPIPNKLKHLPRLEKNLISKRILFKKVAIMHERVRFSKIKGTICNVTTASAEVCIV